MVMGSSVVALTLAAKTEDFADMVNQPGLAFAAPA